MTLPARKHRKASARPIDFKRNRDWYCFRDSRRAGPGYSEVSAGYSPCSANSLTKQSLQCKRRIAIATFAGI